MEALIKDRLTSIDFPEQKILNLESHVKEHNAENFPDKVGDWGVLFSYHVLEGFGHKLASNLEGAELEGLKQLASLWGTYLAKEMERFFKRRQIFTASTDLMFDLFLGLFRQIPVKELGEAIRESVTPAYIRAGEMVRYEIAVFHNDQARMSDRMSVIKASDTELQHEIADMFRGYSTKRLGEEMQRSITEAMSQIREVFSSSDFKDKFDNQIPAAISAGFRKVSWYLGYRISQNLRSDKQRTTRLLEAVSRHREIEAAMEQYRYRHGWQGDRNRVVELAWRAIAPKYFRCSGKLEKIEEDEEQEKLIGMVQGLEDYTKKNRAIKALTGGFCGTLSAYLKTTAQNEEKDYWDKNTYT